MEEIRFDEHLHLYYYDGRIVPSVTQIIGSANMTYTGNYTERSAALGNAVHKACELYDQGILDDDTVDNEVSDYLTGWIAIRNEYKILTLENEMRVFNRDHWYAGTLDKIVKIREFSENLMVLDIKTGAKNPTHKLQTAAYRLAAMKEARALSWDRAAVYLRSDKPAELVIHGEHSYIDDVNAFLSIITQNNWKAKNGIRVDYEG